PVFSFSAVSGWPACASWPMASGDSDGAACLTGGFSPLMGGSLVGATLLFCADAATAAPTTSPTADSKASKRRLMDTSCPTHDVLSNVLGTGQFRGSVPTNSRSLHALHSKADRCSANTDVGYGPIADIDHVSHILERKKRPPIGGLFEIWSH